MSRAQVFVLVSGVALLLLVFEMVRRRRLREEYSWLWLLTALGYLAVAVFPDLQMTVANLLGSVNPVSAFTFLGLLFLFLISIQFSIQISRLASQNKDLVQHVAILDAEIKSLTAAQRSIDAQEVELPVEQQEGVEQANEIESVAVAATRPAAARPVLLQTD